LAKNLVQHFVNFWSMSLKRRIEIIQGDITKLKVTAIVNAANKTLLGGGGVDGAIHKAAGNQLLEACKLLNGCKTGEAKITLGYNLPAKYIIHTVGPIWHDGEKSEPELLAKCYNNSLKLAVEKRVDTLAFPNISTGIYGFPKEEAAFIAKQETEKFLKANASIRKVIFAIFEAENYAIYSELFDL
jgi:O-acetyl-ADP-ribose deacetylase (regulator of RNase III)